MKFKMLAAAPLLLALAACSTAVTEKPGTGVAAAGPVAVQAVQGKATAANVPGDLIERLTLAIKTEAAHQSGGAPATLEFTVVDYKQVSGAARALGGMLGGSDRLHVAVAVKDPSGKTLREFDVDRKSNPGALGAVSDAEGGLINAAAKSIGEQLAK
ncbi:MAG: hypothetical protein JSR98_00555 [Proteobacteria bacterium]|nr:hypothetical protein [Pseudomonadota bacterium]